MCRSLKRLIFLKWIAAVRWLVPVLLILGIAAVSFWWFYLRPPYGITLRSFNKIEKGMTLAKVERIIGLPPGFHNVPDDFAFERCGFLPIDARGFDRTEDWIGPEASITVYLDANGIVLAKEYGGPESTSFLSRLLEMFGL
jgi:hypothetical protein